MSEHTKGRLDFSMNMIATAYDLFEAQIPKFWIASVKSRANARRLAACWNAFDAPCMTTPMIEALVNIGGVDTLSETAAALTKELNAARALLREVYEDEALKRGYHYQRELAERIGNYLDACDTLEGRPNAG